MKHRLVAKSYDKHSKLISTATNQYRKFHPLQAYYANKVGHPQRIYLHA